MPVKPQDVIIYELSPRNFSAQGTLNAVTDQLQRLKNLGVNTIYIMPVQPIGKPNRKGTYGSPYSVQDYIAINPDFGNHDDFKRLVDTAHGLQLNVMMDWVANHTAWDHAWITEHPDWYTHDAIGNIVSPNADWTDVADLNYDNHDMRRAMTGSMLFWIDTFGVDGFRCDMAELVPDDFWKECITELNTHKPMLMLAESARPELYDAGFNMSYGWELYHALKKIWTHELPVSAYNDVIQQEKSHYTGRAYRPIRFITNHDENSWDNTPNVLFNGDNGMMAAFTLMVFSEGVTFIFNGQEGGFGTRINLFERYNIECNNNPTLTQYYKDVLKLYAVRDDIRTGETTYGTEDETGIRITKKSGDKHCTLIANTSSEKSVNIDTYKTAPVLIERGYKDGVLYPYGFMVFES